MKGGVPSIVLSEILHMFLQSGKNICSGFFWRVAYHLRARALLWALLLSWGDNPREGGRIAMLIPLPLLGFLPQSPTFLLPHPPGGCDAALHIPRMLHKTVLNKSCAGNRGKVSRRFVPHKRGEGVEKRAREKTVGRGENKQLAALSPLPKRLSLAQRGGALSMPPGLSPQDKGRAVMLNPYG